VGNVSVNPFAKDLKRSAYPRKIVQNLYFRRQNMKKQRKKTFGLSHPITVMIFGSAASEFFKLLAEIIKKHLGL
jgi:hypothetical protein